MIPPDPINLSKRAKHGRSRGSHVNLIEEMKDTTQSQAIFIPCSSWTQFLALPPGELSPRDQAALDDHLEQCSSCQQVREEYAHIDAELRNLPTVLVPPDLLSRILQQHRELSSSKKGKRSKPPKFPPALPQHAFVEKQSLDDEQLASALAGGESPFSSLLRTIVQHDRSEITRLARGLDVAENTIYRWMNGSSVPRAVYLKRIPEVLSEQRDTMINAINQTFPGVLDTHPTKIQEAQKDIYRRVLELAAISDEDDTCFWQVSQALFDYALEHLDVDRQGIAITYARAMPPYEGRIRSLYEAAMRGNPPWPYMLEARGYLGSTTLAGQAAMFQRMQYWSAADVNSRQPVERDEFELSACAAPILRRSRIAGVLVVSCAHPAFFTMPVTREAVVEYARLLTVGIADSEFQSISLLDLKPMPSLAVQRERIAQTFISRVLAHVRTYGASRNEAEQQVRHEMEVEFEQMAHQDSIRLDYPDAEHPSFRRHDQK